MERVVRAVVLRARTRRIALGILDDQLAVKRLKFDDVISEKANERNPESKAEQFDADFAIMAGELKNFIRALTNAFGGEIEAN